MKTVTLAVCNYNREKTIERAVRSCLSQVINQTSVEVIVVDDASTDQSLSLLKNMADDIKLISVEENVGIGAASNIALKCSSGKYWMRVDSDDYLSMYAASTFSLLLDSNPDVDFVYGDILRLAQDGKISKRISLAENGKYMDYGAGVMFRSSILKDVGGYDDNLRNAEDYDLFMRLKQRNAVGFHIPIPLYRYYGGNDNLTNGLNRKAVKERLERIYKNV